MNNNKAQLKSALKLSLVTSCLFLPALAAAQTAPKAEEANKAVVANTAPTQPVAGLTKFDTVTVVATKTPQNTHTVPAMVSVVDYSANPEIANSTRLSDVAAKVPGLNFYGGPRATGETPQLRGFSQKGVIVTVDGKKQNFDSVHDGRLFLDPQVIKRVEVVKGPSSSIYGSGGLGGVVAFETKDAADVVKPGKEIGYETSVGFNSANMEVLGSQLAGIVKDNADALVAVTGSKGDDIRLGGGTTARDDSRVISGLAKVGYKFNETTSLKVDASTFQGEGQAPNNPQAGPKDTTAVNKVDRSNESNSLGAKLGFDKGDDLIDLTTHAYYTTTSVEERVLQASTTNVANSVLENEIETVGLTIDNKSKVKEFAGANHTFTYGVEYIGNQMEGKDSARAFRWGVPNAESTQMGAFIQDELKFGGFTGADSAFYIVPGGRFDKYENEPDSAALKSQDESHFSPKLAGTYEFNKNYNVFASWAEAFRAPTMSELYLSGTHFPTGASTANVFLANPNLKPEVAQTFEYGFGTSFDNVLQAADKIKFKVSRFETRAEDYIDQQIGGIVVNLQPNPPPYGVTNGGFTTFNNVDKAKIWGYEAEFEYLSDAYRAAVNAGFVKGTDVATGNNLGTNDAFKVNTDLAYTIPNTSTEIGYLGKYAAGFNNSRQSAFSGVLASYSAYDAINFNRGGYASHGLYTRYTGHDSLEGLSFDLGVDNIFDKRYAEAQARNYEIGRSIFTRVTMKW